MTTHKSYPELIADLDRINAEIAAAQTAERSAAIEQIKTLMAEFGISADELTARRARKKHRTSVAKYRDPISGVTWSGRGREPSWIVGKDRADFVIQPSLV
ncbi:H-NS family nucleoid-associated regulatory protein [Burkholderia sp. 22PA0106]|uniref:H-NS histone family protein n=1 Tax=Burkholderia sp. 22PA0106 TaxID=3237371 RepID=UPI0039C2F0B3